MIASGPQETRSPSSADSELCASAQEKQNERDPEFLGRLEAFCRARIRRASPTVEEQNSWDRFFRSYLAATRRIVQRVGLRGVDVDDCLQDAWTEVFLQLAAGGFNQQRGRLYCWIFTVVRNKAVDLLRSAKPRSAIDSADLDSLPSNRELDPAVAYERKRKHMVLRSALDTLVARLSPSTFQTLYGFWIEEKDCSQMARELGLTLDQVRYRRCRAKQSLRRLLQQWPEWGERAEMTG